MKSIRFNRQAGSLGVVAAMLVAFIAPTIALAAQVTERSIALGNSSRSATNVSYQVNFKASAGAATAGAFVVDFCANSPVIGQACTPPTGFTAAGATSTTSGFTGVTGGVNKVVVIGEIDAEEAVSVTLDGINNPTVTGPMYARILTFETSTQANAYTSQAPGAGKIDDGGVAISITDTVGVSGTVQEALTFCVARATITGVCANASANPPTVAIGEDLGNSIVALSATAVSTGNIYTQLSTNAVGGAVVNLKSTTPCGGMKRVSAAGCDIAPALKTGLLAGEAKFGVLVNQEADTTNPAAPANGVLQANTASGYNDTSYVLNYLANNSTGITSPFGDPILDTNGAPANGKNARLTFGASISNNTPAGAYASNLSLIATGKF
ncbi:MAG: hypothetical protein EOO17_02095 [Chloroflexi bacterium]|nr:MAG: hypothetical protein EOO17_02095 [Chloroflexota bacterium]